MAHFHDLCHRNCTLNYIKGILELRKLDFGGLEGQFDVKKANFFENSRIHGLNSSEYKYNVKWSLLAKFPCQISF